MKGVTIVDHPLVQHKLTLLRDKERVIGSVNYDQDPPVFNVIRERILECGDRHDTSSLVEVLTGTSLVGLDLIDALKARESQDQSGS